MVDGRQIRLGIMAASEDRKNTGIGNGYNRAIGSRGCLCPPYERAALSHRFCVTCTGTKPLPPPVSQAPRKQQQVVVARKLLTPRMATSESMLFIQMSVPTIILHSLFSSPIITYCFCRRLVNLHHLPSRLLCFPRCFDPSSTRITPGKAPSPPFPRLSLFYFLPFHPTTFRDEFDRAAPDPWSESARPHPRRQLHLRQGIPHPLFSSYPP